MQLLILFLEFFKIGLFSVGGGLATLPSSMTWRINTLGSVRHRFPI